MLPDPTGFDAEAFCAWCAATPDLHALEHGLGRVPAPAWPAVAARLRVLLAPAAGAPAAGETNAARRDRRARDEQRRHKLDAVRRQEARWWHAHRTPRSASTRPPAASTWPRERTVTLWKITLLADDTDALRGQQVRLPLTAKILATGAVEAIAAGPGGQRIILVDGGVSDVEAVRDAFVAREGVTSRAEPAPDGRYTDRDGTSVDVRDGRVNGPSRG
jgi:hypothetical protein